MKLNEADIRRIRGSAIAMVFQDSTASLNRVLTIGRQIIDLLKRRQDEPGMSIIWITHDLGVVAGLAHRMAVRRASYIPEEAPVLELYPHPRHPSPWAC